MIPVGIPTAFTLAETVALQRLADARRVLEIGALFGHSTITMAYSASRVVSIDPHEGYPNADSPSTLQPFLDNLKKYGVADKVTPILAKSFDVLPYLAPNMFDLVFIDITADALRNLIAVEKLNPKFIAIHDCFHRQWPEATEALNKFLGWTSYKCEYTDSLGVITL